MDETALNDLLECSVCLERLDVQNKVLPCQHTFCKKCLEEILTTQKELRCPECRVLVTVRIDDLPPNVLLVRILEGMKYNPRGKENSDQKSDPRVLPQLSAPPVPQHQVLLSDPPRVASQRPQNPQAILRPQLSHSQHVPSTLQQLPSTPQHAPQLLQPQVMPQLPRQELTIPQLDLETPCAKALYNFDAQEPGDLSFKKGDVIQLRRQIDPNWFLGELRGQQGFFPATYVQVLVPLPVNMPLCKALYDFKMTNDEEKDCLSFSKGDTISVIRRVDENWAEGKMKDRIGIFPVSFVEMNGVAKAMMKAFVSSAPGSSRPTPSISDMIPRPATSGISGSAFSFVTRSLQLLASQLTTSTPSSSELFTSSSSTGTENTSMTQSHSPMSGSILGPLPVFGLRVNGMSNSLQVSSTPSGGQGVMTSSLVQNPLVANPSEASREGAIAPSGPHCRVPVRTRDKRLSYNVVRSTPSSPTRETNRRSMDVSQGASRPPTGTPDPGPTIAHRRNNSHPSDLLGGFDGETPKTPELFIAMYPYKPQKPDEIELKKGSLYSVTEKCRDGWFIGESIRTRQSGVFPGNYVQPLRSKMGPGGQLLRETPIGQNTSLQNMPPQVGEGSVPSNATVAPPPSQRGRRHTTTQNSNPSRRSRVSAPELPPRMSVQRTPNTTPKKSVLSPKSAPSSRRGSRCEPDVPGGRLMSPRKTGGKGSDPHSAPIHPLDKLPPPKEKISIIQRLTSRKKSTNTSLFSIENPVFDDGSGGSNPASGACSPVPNQPVHARSGSCPSQLINLAVSTSSPSQSRESPARLLPSVFERLRTHDTPPHPPKPAGDSSPPSVASDPLPHVNRRANKQPMPPMRERYRCVTSYPPNSEHELELRVGDLVYVHKKREDGWLKGTLQRTGRTGLFPSNFVEPVS